MTTWADVKNAIHFWNTGDTWGEGRLGIFDADEKQWIYDTLEEFYENSPTAQYWLNLLTLPGVVGLRIGEGAQLEALDNRTSVSFVKDVDLVMVNQSGTLVTSQSKYHLIHEILHVIMRRGDNQTPDIFTQNLANYDFFGPIVREEQQIASEMGDLDQILSAYLMRFSTAEAASFFGWSVNENYTDGQAIKYSRMGSVFDDFLDMQAHDPGDPSADLIIGMEGGDEIRGASGNDHLYGDFTNAMGPGGNDRLYGGNGDDRLYGGEGEDLLSGGAGDDVITGGPGNDILWGGDVGSDQGGTDGVDTANFASANGRVVISFDGSGEAPTLTVGSGTDLDTLHSIERIIGTAQIDYLYYSGSIPENYDLTIDFAGGNDDVTNGGVSVTGLRIVIGPDNNGTLSDYDGTPSGPGGYITLLNVHSQVIGSAHDDWISDAASGTKRMDGGDGNDVITIGGDAQARLSGGAGDDILTGGDGSDVLIDGDGDNQLFGGAGTDMLISDRVDYSVEADLLDGGAGSDLLIARGESNNVVLRGGGGNDLIDARAGSYVIVHFGANDGNDTVEGEGYVGMPTLDGFSDDWSLGIADIVFAGLDLDDVTIHWDLTIADEVYDAGALRWDYLGIGDLAVVVNATGASIFFRNFANSFSTFGHHDPINQTTSYSSFNLPGLVFDDGQFEAGESAPNIDIVIGSVAQYDVARADYAAGVEDSIVDDVATSGDDELSGGIGGDSLAGGEGNDSFRASGGTDVFDGGAGADTLFLFGALLDFLIARNAATGDVTFADQAGAEGAITVKSVEKIYFAKDDEEYEIGDLVGFWGTPGDDALVEGNANDNVIHGLAGADLLRGLAGNDVLLGDSGDDVMDGGAGDDVYRVEDSGDLIAEAAGGGQDGVYVAMNVGAYALAAGAEVEILAAIDPGSTEALALTGNEYANTLFGAAGVNVLIGGGGADTLAGGGGNDIYRVEEAGDTVLENAGGGADAVYAVVSYALGAGQEVEILSAIDPGSTAAMDLTGSDFGNTLIGTAGANILIGGGGNDVLAGGGGNDLYRVEDAGDIVLEYAGGGADAVYAVGSYALAAGYEIEVLAAIDPNSTAALNLTGNDHGNTIFASNGANVIDGKGGGDALVGYGGADTFAFTTALGGGNSDWIVDFAAGTDKIGLDDAIFTAIGGSLGAGAFVTGSAAADANDRIVYNQTTGQLFYDADGSGAGAAVQFAILTTGLTLTAGDFAVI